jgi:hypothetical protein
LDAILIIGAALFIGLGVASVFAIVYTRMARATAQFRTAIDHAFPELARTHGLILTPKGSPDRLPRLDGSYRGVHVTVELFLARFPSRDMETGRESQSFEAATRIFANSTEPLPGSFDVELGPMMDGSHGYAIRHATDLERVEGFLAGARASLLSAFGLERAGIVRSDGNTVVLEWYRAEDDVEVLSEGVELVAHLASPPVVRH